MNRPFSHLQNLRLAIIAGFILAAPLMIAQEAATPITIGETIQFQSEILGETRPLMIYKPVSYDITSDAYPVMYLLDGAGNFHHSTGVVRFLSEFHQMPRMLVVAIPNPSFASRTRDLTPPVETDTSSNFSGGGGADNFLSFISDELMPYIEANYRTHPYRLLVGHSFGGLFAVHALISRPDVFDSYIAISPSLWWDNQGLLPKADAFFDEAADLKGYFYMTMGNEGGNMLSSAWKFAAILEEKAPAEFGWQFTHMDDETHTTIPHRSTYHGLEAIFDGWHLGNPFMVYNSGGLEALNAHFAKLDEKFNFEIKTPETMLNNIGYRLMGQEKFDEAIHVFEQNVVKYPTSYNVYDSLGEAFLKAGQTESAIANYKKSLELNPDNTNARRVLGELGVAEETAPATAEE